MGFAQTELWDSVKKWESFPFSKRLIPEHEFHTVHGKQLAFLRGIVFGKHGRIFKEELIHNFLYTRPWYRPDPNFTNARLNGFERKNLDLIRRAERYFHQIPQPGDMRFWQDERMLDVQLSQVPLGDLVIIRAEIEAVHGKIFSDKVLQRYFEERYWYQPNPSYRSAFLTEIERDNIALVDRVLTERRGSKIVPGSMDAFRDQVLRPSALQGLTLWELRVLRHEIYARRGKRFSTDWLRGYFAVQAWYEPRPRMEPLGPIELANVDVLLAEERLVLQRLSTTKIDAKKLEGLTAAEARKLRLEITAKHGQPFSDPSLDRYFRSFSWYRPNPAFRIEKLNSIERANYETVLAYESRVRETFSQAEG
jgi:hypothetical protein